MSKKCLYCGKVFFRSPKYSDAQWELRKCCDRSCGRQYGVMIGTVKPLKGFENGTWKGGRFKRFDGYCYVLVENHPFATKKLGNRGYVLEHRYVMEKHIGRYLLPKEVVHHKNRDKSDNRIENLELFENNAAHMKQHTVAKGTKWKKENPWSSRVRFGKETGEKY